MNHRGSRLTPTLLALGAGLLLGAEPAQADSLETPFLGADNLAAGGGWQAWSAAQPDGRYRLTLRSPDGSVSTPAIDAFGAPVDPAIGTRGGADGINTNASRRLSAVYSRCSGTSRLSGCDVYALDLTTMEETEVGRLASETYSETVPSLNFGQWAFVRRGGTGRGTFAYSESRNKVTRLSRTMARETAIAARVAFTYNTRRGFGVQIRQASGKGGPLIAASRLDDQPLSPSITRYRVGWLVPEETVTRVFQSERFAGSGCPCELTASEADRTLPGRVSSGSGDRSALYDRYVDARGIERVSPRLK